MVKCSKCGAEIISGDKFCGECGQSITAPPPSSPKPAPAQPKPASKPAPKPAKFSAPAAAPTSAASGSQASAPASHSPQKKKSGCWKWLLLLIAIFIAAAVAFHFFEEDLEDAFFAAYDAQYDAPDETTQTAQTGTEAPPQTTSLIPEDTGQSLGNQSTVPYGLLAITPGEWIFTTELIKVEKSNPNDLSFDLSPQNVGETSSSNRCISVAEAENLAASHFPMRESLQCQNSDYYIEGGIIEAQMRCLIDPSLNQRNDLSLYGSYNQRGINIEVVTQVEAEMSNSAGYYENDYDSDYFADDTPYLDMTYRITGNHIGTCD